MVASLHPTDLNSGNHFITWMGMDENGDHLPPGKYNIVIEAQSSGEGETVGVSPLVRADVNGVDLGEGGAMLLTDVGEFALSSIYGVYSGKGEKIEPKDGEHSSEKGNIFEQVSAATDGAGII